MWTQPSLNEDLHPNWREYQLEQVIFKLAIKNKITLKNSIFHNSPAENINLDHFWRLVLMQLESKKFKIYCTIFNIKKFCKNCLKIWKITTLLNHLLKIPFIGKSYLWKFLSLFLLTKTHKNYLTCLTKIVVTKTALFWKRAKCQVFQHLRLEGKENDTVLQVQTKAYTPT